MRDKYTEQATSDTTAPRFQINARYSTCLLMGRECSILDILAV